MPGPINTWKNKGIKVAAWETKNGGTSFTFQKSYKNKETGEWIETKTYFDDDLKALASLIEQALAWVHRAPEENSSTDGFEDLF
jgi:hypothetical protein